MIENDGTAWNDINNCDPVEDIKTFVRAHGGKVFYGENGKVNIEKTMLKGVYKMEYKIEHRYTGEIIISGEAENYIEFIEKNKAYLSRAYLRGANLSGSNLSGSNLFRAYLRGANLSGSNLSGSDLRGSNLSGSNLSGSDLSGANLSGSTLCNCCFKNTKISYRGEIAIVNIEEVSNG